MTETSYTAWDDKLYQWPPPEGWYEAGDGKWWPEGYGPGPAGAGSDPSGVDAATHVDAGAGVDAAGDAAEVAGDGVGAGLGDAADVTAAAAGATAAAGAVTGADDVAEKFAESDPFGLSDTVGSPAGSGTSTTDAFSGSVSDVANDALADVFGSASDHEPDPVSDDGGDAATGLGSPGDAASATGELAGSAWAADAAGHSDNGLAGRLSDAVGGDDGPGSDAFAGTDLPGSDDIGAALAETMSARSDDVVDPASSGIPGSGHVLADDAAEAAADATQFLTADLPDPEPGLDRPKTDLDALPPPPYTPPAFGDATVTEAADNLADLAEPASGFGDQPVDPAPNADSLFSDRTQAGSDEAPSPPDAGFDHPIDETLPPSTNSLRDVLDRSAGTRGPSSDDLGTDPGPGFGRPDETIVAPLTGSTLSPSSPGPNPAETGQFAASPPDAGPWGTPPPPGQFGAPPPPGAQPEPAGSMPWGQAGGAGGLGGPSVPPGGLDQAVLRADDRSGSSRTLLLVGLGVAALVLIGVVGYLLFGGDGGDDSTAAVQTGPGSFAQPHTRTTPVEIFYPDGDTEQRFIIEVLEPVRDASGEADAEPPGDGELFAVTRVRVTNQTSADAPVADLRFNAVTAAGDVIDREATACSVTEPPLDFAITLGQAGVAEGAVCWVVPAGSFDGLLLGIESTQVDGRIHISLQ